MKVEGGEGVRQEGMTQLEWSWVNGAMDMPLFEGDGEQSFRGGFESNDRLTHQPRERLSAGQPASPLGVLAYQSSHWHRKIGKCQLLLPGWLTGVIWPAVHMAGRQDIHFRIFLCIPCEDESRELGRQGGWW
jgi:hypothetical protein